MIQTDSSCGIYIHIPFCSRICPFCSFCVQKNDESLHADYFKTLKLEFDLRLEKGFSENQVRSIYFGGGTPSLVNSKIYADFFSFLKKKNLLKDNPSISFEFNPEDLNTAYLKDLIELGVNRFSLGLQSFFDEHLLKLGRKHTAKDCLKALSYPTRFPEADWNFDLMYGFPSLKAAELMNNLQLAIDAAPSHISFYGLTLEEGTPFARKQKLINWIDSHDEFIAEQYLNAVELLSTANYENYELSNFAKSGKRSVQNEIYWNDRPYFAFGVGAHSYFNSRRTLNHSDSATWKRLLSKGEMPFLSEEFPDRTQRMSEFLIIGFRKKDGIRKTAFSEHFGKETASELFRCCSEFFKSDFMRITEDGIFPTAKGFLLADAISLKVFEHLTKHHSKFLSLFS